MRCRRFARPVAPKGKQEPGGRLHAAGLGDLPTRPGPRPRASPRAPSSARGPRRRARPARPGPEPAPQMSALGSSASNRPNGAISTRRRTLAPAMAAASAVRAPPTELPMRSMAGRSSASRGLHGIDDPVVHAVQMTELLRAREARQRGHDDAPGLAQPVEELGPAGHTTDAGEKDRRRMARGLCTPCEGTRIDRPRRAIVDSATTSGDLRRPVAPLLRHRARPPGVLPLVVEQIADLRKHAFPRTCGCCTWRAPWTCCRTGTAAMRWPTFISRHTSRRRSATWSGSPATT